MDYLCGYILTLENPWGHLRILLGLTPDDFTRQRGKYLGSLGIVSNSLGGISSGGLSLTGEIARLVRLRKIAYTSDLLHATT